MLKFFKRPWYNEKNTLRRRYELVKGMILDNIEDLECHWIMSNEQQKVRADFIRKVEANLEEESKLHNKPDRTEEDKKRLFEIREENKGLGYKDLDNHGKIIWSSDGLVVKADAQLGNIQGKIQELVAKREQLDLQLSAMEVLIKRFNNGESIFKGEQAKGRIKI